MTPDSTLAVTNTCPKDGVHLSELRQKPEMKYRPHLKLSGENQSILIGDYMVAVSKTPPYTGWNAFRLLCRDVLQAVQQTALISTVERFSLKCLNILELRDRHPLQLLNAQLNLADMPIRDDGLKLRAEIGRADFTTILELAAIATATGSVEPPRSGLLLSVDSLRETTADEFWPDVMGHLDSVHDVVKEVFFSVLKPEVVEGFGPTWSE